MSKRIYQEYPYLRSAAVTPKAVLRGEEEHAAAGVRYLKGCITVLSEDSLFFPEGGGQPCDLGYMGGLRLSDVKDDKKSGLIVHRLEEGELSFGEDRSLPGELDWQRRFDHMQMHCAEHIVSGTFLRLYGVENHGFHMGEDYMTIDMTPGEDSPVSEITDEMIRTVELRSNEIVWEDLPVRTVYYDTREEANSQPVRKQILFDEDISVVFIGTEEEPVDCCACCGTHVSSTGQIGLISIQKSENYKGMLRLTLKAGRPAVTEALREQQSVLRLCRRFSAEPPELEDKVAAYENKNGLIRKELYDLKKDILAEEAGRVAEAAMAASASEGRAKPFSVHEFPMLQAADLQDLAHLLDGRLSGLAVLVSGKTPDAVLVSGGDPACGSLVKDYAPIYQGKGGGNPKLARAIFKSREDLELFIDLIDKHLR